MRRHLWAVLLGLGVFAPGTALAGEPPTGHWRGSYDCQGVSQNAEVDIWPDASEPDGLRGRIAFSAVPGGNTPSGSYYVSLQRINGTAWKAVPEQWETQPEGYVMVAMSFYYTMDHIGGLVEDPICMGKTRWLGFNWTGESQIEASAAPAVGSGDSGGTPTVDAPTQWEQPDYMRRAAEERKEQNRQNCERASQGANVSCQTNPY
jgi:hypothetical protein